MEMIQVLPGDMTGIYYIPVAGLPWNCSWQRLKDFCKSQQPDGTCLEIDHVHVDNEGSGTSGWVRVTGKQNFRKMMTHLQTVPMGDRCLIAFSENEKAFTSIKVPVSTEHSAHPRRARNDSASSTDTHLSSTGNYYGHQNNPSISVYPGSEGWYAQQQALANSPMSPTMSYYQQSPTYDNTASPYASNYFPPSTQPNVVYAGQMPPSTPVYVPQITQAPVYTYTVPLTYSEPHQAPTTTSYPQSLAQKIVITSLPSSISHSQLQQLLYKYISRAQPRSSSTSPKDELLSLEIVAHPDQNPKVHAFAVISSESIARYVVRCLEGLRFQGRDLRAKPAKEGVESTTTQYSAAEAPQSMAPYSDDQYSAFAGPSTSGPSTRQDSRTKKEKEREGEREREGRDRERDKKKDTSPVVANGSSSGSDRRRKHRGG